MRYKAKSVAALQLALGSLPDEMQWRWTQRLMCRQRRSATLPKVEAWPANLAVITPIGSDPPEHSQGEQG